MESQVKTITKTVHWVEFIKNDFSAADFTKLFGGTGYSLELTGGKVWLCNGVYCSKLYEIKEGDLLVREGNTVSKWDKEAFEEEFNTQI